MKLSTKKIFFVGLAFLIICLFWQVYDNIIAKMLINTFGLNQTWSGIVMALDNVLALILLPVFGALSDKTKTKIGKRKPYIIAGVILSAVLFVGVAIFDNLQRDSLKDVGMGEVVSVDDAYLESASTEYTEEQIAAIRKYHYGDFLFEYSYTNEDVLNLFITEDIKSEEIARYFALTDVDLKEDKFIELYNKVLTAEDKQQFSQLLALSHDERTKLEFTESLGFLDKLMGKDPTISASRLYQKQLNELEDLLAQRISEQEDSSDILLDLGVKQYFSTKEYATQTRGKVVWVQTKNDVGYLIGFVVILIFVLLAMAVYRTPAVSLMPDVTPKPLRSKANAIINLMGTVGGVISLLLMSFLAKDYQSYILLFLIIGTLMIALMVVFVCTVNEPKMVKEMEEESIKYGIEETVADEVATTGDVMPKDVRKSFYLILASIIFWFMAYNAATTKFSVYAGDVLNMGYTFPLLIANITAIISYIPIGLLASKFGRKHTIIVGVLILMGAFILGSIATEKTTFLIYLTMGIAGIGWATINVNSYPMIVEMSKGNNVGRYTGYYYTASMFAQIITPIVSGFIMDISGTMRVLFPYSVVFCVLALITMLQVKHGDSKPVPTTTIEAFDVDE